MHFASGHPLTFNLTRMKHTRGRCTRLGFQAHSELAGPNCTRVVAQSSGPSVPVSSAADIIVAGCAKNLAHHKAPFVWLLGRTLQFATTLIVYEDGSTDDTRASLLQFAATTRQPASTPTTIRFIFADAVGAFFDGDDKRERKLALCRHTLLHEALAQSRASGSLGIGSAFMVALDLDCTPPRQESIRAAVARMLPPWLTTNVADGSSDGSRSQHGQQHGGSSAADDDEVAEAALPASVAAPPYAWDAWDVLSAAPAAGADYYDHSALRAPVLSPHFALDCWYDLRNVVRYGNCVEHQLTLAVGAPIVPVESAFNGLAVYRLAALARSGCGYVPYYRVMPHSRIQPVVVRGACEHVAFHLCLRRARLRLGIDSSLPTGCWAGWRSRRVAPLMRVHVGANGTLERTFNPNSPKSTTRLLNMSSRMRTLHATLLKRAETETLQARVRAKSAARLWGRSPDADT